MECYLVEIILCISHFIAIYHYLENIERSQERVLSTYISLNTQLEHSSIYQKRILFISGMKCTECLMSKKYRIFKFCNLNEDCISKMSSN